MAEVATREVYGRTLMELGKKRPDLVVLDADLSPSTMTLYFAREFPGRFFDCGIAEQNMMAIAAGLSASGKLVFVSTFAVFATCKAYDQLRQLIAQPGLNVKVVATHAGISVGEDGFSHHAIEDLALMGAIPGFTVVVPADGPETEQAVWAAARLPGPFYIRLSRPKTPIIHPSPYTFEVGQAEVMRAGQDVGIIACGLMVAQALEAARHLAQDGVEAQVINMATLKPLDQPAVVKVARETGALVVAEEHLEHGGLGSRVAQVVGKHHPVPLELVALQDCFASSGPAESLLHQHGLCAEAIVDAARRALRRKG